MAKLSDWVPYDKNEAAPMKPKGPLPKTVDRKKTWRDKVYPVLNAIQPVTRVAASVASIAVHLKSPTVMGIAMAASAGANTLRDLIGEPPSSGHGIQILCSRSYALDAFRKAGATVTRKEGANGVESADINIHGKKLHFGTDGFLFTADGFMEEEFFEWLRQMLDAELPSTMEVKKDQYGTWSSTPFALTQLRSTQGPKILEQTMPMLKDGRRRVVLLTGVPGVGKTTMAQEIARLANLGRVIHLEATAVGVEKDQDYNNATPQKATRGFTAGTDTCIKLLSPGVVIVDDIHRVSLSLAHIEGLRKAARLVIFTANLPEDDNGETLDGAEIRSGRIDEVFNVQAEHSKRQEPFDKLPDEIWEKVKFWPIAFLNELEVRLNERPNDLRIEDLEKRIGVRTRSARRGY
jgi:predicted kinase